MAVLVSEAILARRREALRNAAKALESEKMRSTAPT
jgi:hypothetical protein